MKDRAAIRTLLNERRRWTAYLKSGHCGSGGFGSGLIEQDRAEAAICAINNVLETMGHRTRRSRSGSSCSMKGRFEGFTYATKRRRHDRFCNRSDCDWNKLRQHKRNCKDRSGKCGWNH